MGYDSISNVNISKIEANEQKEKELNTVAKQVSSEESFEEACSQAFNPFAADKDKEDKFKSLNERKEDAKEVAKEIKKGAASAKTENSAYQFQQKNPELQAKSLMQLLSSLNKNDSQSEVLKKVQNFYPDPSLADEALEFLKENTEGELKENIQNAQKELNKLYGRQIVAGKNIAEQARTFSNQGLGSPGALRELYREITGNPKPASELFSQLSKLYNFDQLKKTIQFLLHSLGADLKNKGPSMPRGELAVLFNETRTLQAIFGVYKFFQSRMRLIDQAYNSSGKTMPSTLTFEALAKAFMKLVEEKYPNFVKITASAEELAKQRDLLALILIISQFREAIRGVSPRIYRDMKHKEELLESLIKSLEELEEDLEEENEEDEDES